MIICPECVAPPEAIYEFVGTTTLLAWHPFYDENGVKHYHNPNAKTMDYRCSEGHVWTQRWYSKCPSCAWTNGGHNDHQFRGGIQMNTSDRARELAEEWVAKKVYCTENEVLRCYTFIDKNLVPEIAAILDLLVEAREEMLSQTVRNYALIEKIDRVLGER